MNRLKENGKYAFLAGFCGATGSLFGKLSGGYYEYEVGGSTYLLIIEF